MLRLRTRDLDIKDKTVYKIIFRCSLQWMCLPWLMCVMLPRSLSFPLQDLHRTHIATNHYEEPIQYVPVAT